MAELIETSTEQILLNMAEELGRIRSVAQELSKLAVKARENAMISDLLVKASEASQLYIYTGATYLQIVKQHNQPFNPCEETDGECDVCDLAENCPFDDNDDDDETSDGDDCENCPDRETCDKKDAEGMVQIPVAIPVKKHDPN